ncbi:MAG: hypothetical protein D6732_24680, partial [Methanobacteriota archaeon]
MIDMVGPQKINFITVLSCLIWPQMWPGWVLVLFIFDYLEVPTRFAGFWNIHFLPWKDQLRTSKVFIQAIISSTTVLAVIFVYTHLRSAEAIWFPYPMPFEVFVVWFFYLGITMTISYQISRRKYYWNNEKKEFFQKAFSFFEKINALDTFMDYNEITCRYSKIHGNSVEFVTPEICDFFDGLIIQSKAFKFVPSSVLSSPNCITTVSLLSNTLIPTFLRNATNYRITRIILPIFDGFLEFMMQKNLVGLKTNDNLKTVQLQIRDPVDSTDEGFVYSPPNMPLLEALEEYYELHREEIEGQVADLKEELRQTIRRYEGKRLWLMG